MKTWKRIKGLVIAAAFVAVSLMSSGAVADAVSDGRLYITESGGTITLGCKAPCKVELPSTTAGYDVVLDISANTYTYTDGGTGAAGSNMEDIGFGLTETVDWASDRALYHYLVNEDDTKGNVGWFVSLLPCLAVTPGVTYIHDKTANAANDTQYSIFGAWVDDAGKAVKPVRLIGVTRVQFDTDGGIDSYITQTLGNTDGIGQDRLDKTYVIEWTLPNGQNGCQDASEVYDEGGAAATNLAFTTSEAKYFLDSKCWQHVTHDHVPQSVVGANAVQVRWYLPFKAVAGTASTYHSDLAVIYLNSVIYTGFVFVEQGTSYALGYAQAAVATAINANVFADNTDYFYFTSHSPVFQN